MTPSRDELAGIFRDPPAEYGPIDGWWWEGGRLDKDRMRWQLEELQDKGISGSWFYARFLHGEPLGSQPGYFSDGWWEFTKFAAEEHKRLGLINWFSNWTALQYEQNAIREQRKADPSLWGRRVVIHEQTSTAAGPVTIDVPAEDEILDAAAYRIADDVVDHSTRVALTETVRGQKLEWQAPDAGWLVTVVAARPWDLAYLEPRVGDLWNDVIFEEYAKRLPGLMGESPSAYGPDEMLLLNGTTIFSPTLLERIRSERGYDPVPYLVGLFHDIGQKTDQIRSNYYEALSAVLDENFYQASTRWLHDHGLKHVTLSQMGDNVITRTFHYGDFFRYLRSFDYAGNEDPLRMPAGSRRLMASKFSASVAHLYDHERAILCPHYATGWGHTMEENIVWTLESYAKGLNLYTRHLGSYSLMGGWYEYVPPSDHWYHPYWRYWKTLADFIRRLSFIMSRGKHRPDVALLYPQTTVYADWVAPIVDPPRSEDEEEDEEDEDEAADKFFGPSAVAASEGVERLAETIYHQGIDFDFVDEPSFLRSAARDGVLETAGVEFRCVVLPPITTIHRSTMERIKAFYDAGGTVVAFERLPTASAEDGRDDPQLKALVDAMFAADAKGAGKAFLVTGDVNRVPEVISDAIERDVVPSVSGIFQTHQRIDDADIYFAFNVGAKFGSERVKDFGEVLAGTLLLADETDRDVTLRFRTKGAPEVFDAWTGETRPIHRFEDDGTGTRIRLRMKAYEGVVVVFAPEKPARAAVVADDLDEVTSVDVSNGTVAVHGFAATGGAKRAQVAFDGQTYAVGGEVGTPPPPHELRGPFTFRVEPTMDNRWGDFRYPASDRKIGAEARRFRYRDEGEKPGTDLGWHKSGHDDAGWEDVQYTHGPYWRQIGPFDAESEPAGVLERALHSDESLDWQPYTFSKKFGSGRRIPREGFVGWFQHMLGVPENFILLDGPPVVDKTHHHYLSTTVDAPEDGEYLFCVGRKPGHPELTGLNLDDVNPYRVPDGTQAWVNGTEVLKAKDESGTDIRVKVHLREGRNHVLLKVVHPEGGDETSFAVLLASEPEEQDQFIMSLTWFREPQRLVYDVKPDVEHPIGWYRFTAPPGTREIRLQATARSIEAWIDGEPAAVKDGVISVGSSGSGPRSVALRVTQQRGVYAGAVFEEPVAFEIDEGRIALGDWCDAGLATYSGIGVYGTEVELDKAQLAGRVMLDLGKVKATAEVIVNERPAGVLLGRPYRFDITDLVREGANKIEIKVANTLANHYSTFPTRWVFEGQTESGLFGPVELRFLSPARLVANMDGAVK